MFTGTAPKRLSIDSFFEVDAPVSTIASISSDATSEAARAVSSENYTSAMGYFIFKNRPLQLFPPLRIPQTLEAVVIY